MNASTIVSSSSSSSSVAMQLDCAAGSGAASRTNSVAQRTFHLAGELHYKNLFIKRIYDHVAGQNADIVFQIQLKNNEILRVPEHYLTNPGDVWRDNVFDEELRSSKNAQTVQKGRKRLASPNSEMPPSKKGPQQQPLIPVELPNYQQKIFWAWINYRMGNDQDLTLSDEELKELYKYSNYIQEHGLSLLALSLFTQLPNVEDHAEFLLRELVEKDWALYTSANEYQHFENFLTNFSVWQHVLSPDFIQWLEEKKWKTRPIAACLLAIFYNRIISQNGTGLFLLYLKEHAGEHPLGIALQALYFPLEQKQRRLELAERALGQKSLYGGLVLALINDSVSEHVHTAAAKGLTEAMLWLASSYFEGKRGLAKNESLAFDWWSKAAEKGDAEAIYRTSLCYSSGKGVPKDEPKALQLLIKAAKKENSAAIHDLGSCYFKGSNGVDKDETQAFQWWLKAAKKGYLDAMSQVGCCYSTGIIDVVPQDADQAVHWWSKAAAKEHLGAMCWLGGCYSNGAGVPKNEHEATRWWSKAAEKGHLGAMYNLGVCYSEGIGMTKNETLGIQWVSKATEGGYPDAMNLQALRHFSGNIPLAVELWTKAAVKDNGVAMYWLGYCYFTGMGVTQDIPRAAQEWKKAAESGHREAMLWLANCYKSGLGIEQNEALATQWSQMAAKQELKKPCFPRA